MKNLTLSLLFTVLLLNNLSAQKTNLKKFSLDCSLKNDYSGYIYLEYENIKDSCLIINKHFSFNGIIQNDITSATFSLKGKNTNSPDLYLEPRKIDLEMSIEEKNYEDNSKVTFMKILNAKGSETTQTVIDYSNFIQNHYLDKDIQQQLYKKVDAIVSQNSKNPLACSLICGLSRDEKVNKIELRKIYNKLDRENQNKMLLNIIDENLK